MNQTFPKQNRLRKSPEFSAVWSSGVYAANGCLVIQGNWNSCKVPRLGLSVSKKVGNAVVRNRWKRLIREAFRLQKLQLPEGIDFVVRPKKGAVPEFHRIKQSLHVLCGIVKKKLLKASDFSKDDSID